MLRYNDFCLRLKTFLKKEGYYRGGEKNMSCYKYIS